MVRRKPKNRAGGRENPYPVVLSVSRRTDMVRWYPGDLVRALETRYPPERVHSLVVVTKFPGALLAEPVRGVLARYDQVVAQVTITGLGGTLLEPRVPPAEETLAFLPDLVDFTGSPERVLVRIDPIVHWRVASARVVPGGRAPAEGVQTEGVSAEGNGEGTIFSNLPLFGGIARQAREAGITRVKTSLVSPYPKAVRRFREAGLELVTPSGEERERILAALEEEAAAAGVILEFCCEPSRPRGACIDAGLLSGLHPRGLPARPDRAAGQREHCGCTHAVDLAWYSAHPCPSGCLYCYANPIVGRVASGDPGRPTGPRPRGG